MKTDQKKKKRKITKQQLIKNKHGEILITKLDDYVEPEKKVKEAKGDIRDANIYNFSSLVKEDVDEEEHKKKSEEVKEEKKEEKKKKKKKSKVKRKRKKKEKINNKIKKDKNRMI